MKILVKLMLFTGLVTLLDVAIIFYSDNNFYISVIVIGVSWLINIIYLNKSLVKPLSNLYNALKVIDFNGSAIDFSKLDQLRLSGSSEVKDIQKRFKYLIDIVTERVVTVNTQTYVSEHDGLTGCYNRVHLETAKGLYETSKSCGVVFIDVNNLKKMNDIFGHEAGDALLRSAASKLKFWDNYGDVYRMGGDEFMVVLVNKSYGFIEKLVKQWYPTVGQLNRDTDSFKCLLSYGISYAMENIDFDSLQKEADENMYEMKVAIKKQLGEELR